MHNARVGAIVLNQHPVTPMVDRSNSNATIAVSSVDGRCADSSPSVVAEEFIRPESKSPVIVLDHRRFLAHHQHYKVSLQKGELIANPASNLWPLSMEVATECRMQNVECSMVSTSTTATSSLSSQQSVGHLSLVFTTTRPVEKGQRLYFWFSEVMLARLEMPFLVPKNIQAGDRYVCHRCSSVFTTPNPLKLHMYFHCSNRPVTPAALWNRVLHTLTAKVPTVSEQPISESSSIFQHSRSAFKPTAHLFLSPFLTNNDHQHLHHQQHRPQGTNPAQVESIVSHLGRSKHGHICIYCGKVYSRKYGLKIHIRTHTGYKPLKCPVCSRPFGDPSNLNKHIRLHAEHTVGTGDTPYKCELCGKVLVRRRDLDRHIQSRHSSGSSSQHEPSSVDSIDCASPLSSADSSHSSSSNSGRDESDDDHLDVVDIC